LKTADGSSQKASRGVKSSRRLTGASETPPALWTNVEMVTPEMRAQKKQENQSCSPAFQTNITSATTKYKDTPLVVDKEPAAESLC